MSEEYAKCIGEDFQKVYTIMQESVNKFQESHLKKQYLKKKLKFWK